MRGRLVEPRFFVCEMAPAGSIAKQTRAIMSDFLKLILLLELVAGADAKLSRGEVGVKRGLGILPM